MDEARFLYAEQREDSYRIIIIVIIIIIIIIIVCFLWTWKPGIRRLERREEVAQGAGVSRALAVNRGGAAAVRLQYSQQRRS